MARMMKGEGSIRAYDRFPSKVDALVRTVEGAGLSEMISVRTADAATLETEPADVVLLDAPCSGLGVLRRKPEIRWKREPADITNLAELQRDLISAAARLVAPGGSLVYTTCTIEPEENEDEDLIDKGVSIVRQSQRASASLLQRRLRIGYPRAARLLDQLEERGVVGPSQGGGKERDVLLGPLDEDEVESVS